MTSTKGICRPCKTLESKCSQKQTLRQRFKSQYLRGGDSQEWGKRKVRLGRERSEYLCTVLYRANYHGSELELTAARDILRQKRMCHRVFPVEEDRESISRLLSITGEGEAATEGHSFSGKSSLPSHRQWCSSDQSSS